MKGNTHPMASTPMGKAIISHYEQSQEPYKPRLVCLGCGCTDDFACPGGCSWSQPGICSTCEGRTDELLLKSDIADALLKMRYVKFKIIGAPGFSIMSLAIVAWLREPSAATFHRDRLREGLELQRFTRIRIGQSSWSFSLVYKPKRGDSGITHRFAWKIRTGAASTGKKTKPRRRR